MRSLRLDPALDELVKRAAAQEGASVSEFLRRAARDRAERTLDGRDEVSDLIGSIHSGAGDVARRTGVAFGDVLERRRRT